MIDERTEQLINRRLDGELTQDETLELNKRLIRSPEARALLEEYQRTDALARETLSEWIEPPECHDDRVTEAARRKDWLPRVGVGVRAAAAALLLTTVVGVPSIWWSNPSLPTSPDAPPAVAGIGGPSATPPPSQMFDGPREETDQLHRNVVGIWDEETQSVYLLECDQHARKVTPRSRNF